MILCHIVSGCEYLLYWWCLLLRISGIDYAFRTLLLVVAQAGATVKNEFTSLSVAFHCNPNSSG